MTSPRVTEISRRLEPVARDPFLGVVEAVAPRAVAHIANVVPLRRRHALGVRQPPVRQPPPSATAA